MELIKSFPPADAFVEMMTEIDYKKLWTNILTIGAVCAVILQLMYQQLRKVKFSTPYQVSEWFYLGMDLRPEVSETVGDERFGISINRYYFGVYGNTAQWGKLDENGCL